MAQDRGVLTMQNATCSEIHMEVLLPVLQVYSAWNLFKERGMDTGRIYFQGVGISGWKTTSKVSNANDKESQGST
jgi:hypothetical protein